MERLIRYVLASFLPYKFSESCRDKGTLNLIKWQTYKSLIKITILFCKKTSRRTLLQQSSIYEIRRRKKKIPYPKFFSRISDIRALNVLKKLQKIRVLFEIRTFF